MGIVFEGRRVPWFCWGQVARLVPMAGPPAVVRLYGLLVGRTFVGRVSHVRPVAR